MYNKSHVGLPIVSNIICEEQLYITKPYLVTSYWNKIKVRYEVTFQRSIPFLIENKGTTISSSDEI
jgi:hypothetical protein